MVPLDRPMEALSMITAFVNRKPLEVIKGVKIPSTNIQGIPDKREKRQSFIRARDKSHRRVLEMDGYNRTVRV